MRLKLRVAAAAAVCLGWWNPVHAFHPKMQKHGTTTTSGFVTTTSSGFSAGFVAVPTGFVTTQATGFVAPGGFSTGFVAPGGFSSGFVAPTGFVAPGGFSTGFAAPSGFVAPTGFSTGFVAPTGFSTGFVAPTGFSTSAGFGGDAAFGASVAIDAARRILCAGTAGASSSSGGSGGCESNALLREIRDELRDLKKQGTTKPTPAKKPDAGGKATEPKVKNAGISPDFAAPAQSLITITPNAKAFAKATPVAIAEAYAEVAEFGTTNALKQLDAIKKSAGAKPADYQSVEARLKALKADLNKSVP